MKVVVINSAGNEVARKCIDSLLKTAARDDFDLLIIRERQQRELTLNAALEICGIDEDILFVGDDIGFTPGWDEALLSCRQQADIVGLSMLYPGSTIVEDRGYQLVELDGQITLEAYDRGRDLSELPGFGTRECDAVCGCFMLVGKHVFEAVGQFRLEGANRWGELIFATEARLKGARVVVSDHYLYHAGTSTKSNPDKGLSSVSYQVEKGLWQTVAENFLGRARVRLSKRTRIAGELRNRLKDPSKRILFYGIGTITEKLLKETRPARQRVAFCSGLEEEQGLEYYGAQVVSVEDTVLSDFDLVIVTPLYIGERLFHESIKPKITQDFKGVVAVIVSSVSSNLNVVRCHDVFVASQ